MSFGEIEIAVRRTETENENRLLYARRSTGSGERFVRVVVDYYANARRYDTFVNKSNPCYARSVRVHGRLSDRNIFRKRSASKRNEKERNR